MFTYKIQVENLKQKKYLFVTSVKKVNLFVFMKCAGSGAF